MYKLRKNIVIWDIIKIGVGIMNKEKLEIMSERKGFIAALDQSGGSSGKTLKLYGIDEDKYSNDEEMFDLIHDMRARVIKSKSFTNDRIIGVILFEETMNRKIDDILTSDYLWNKKHILSFLKIDKGLENENNGVRLMKDIPNLESTLKKAKELGIFGTKMRSVINDYNIVGIKDIVEQQFRIAKMICSMGLIPIIEPEVSIDCPNKEKCEILLKEEIIKQLDNLDSNTKVMFKFTIPNIPNFYEKLIDDEKVLRVVALSGGYTKEVACQKLALNKNMIASFSRALLEGLTVNQTEEEFDKILDSSIDKIYRASSM